jgi:DinB superfamily
MEPLVEAAAWSVAQLQKDVRAGLAGQSAEALNWRPYPDGNTISGLVSHMYESGNFLLRTGLGQEVARERDAQFAASMPDTEALLAHVDRSTENLLGLAQSYGAEDLARGHDFRGNAVPGAWFVLHMCEHLQEHWGQIQTIRDLAAQR